MRQPSIREPGAERIAGLMARALALAERGGGATAPNPMVGCIIVDGEGRILGEGFHARAGEPHAEVIALQAARIAGGDPHGATAVVTLEPCAHQGRTPPCVEALAAAGLQRVVYAVEDPYLGKGGAERLRTAGIEVERGVGEAAARRLNEAWLHWVATGRPFFHVKVAQTLSGHVTRGRGGERWITSGEARATVHRLRRRHAAVLVAVGTVLADDPLLTVRNWPARDLAWPEVQPLRVVLDSRLRLPLEARLVTTADVAPVLVFCGPDAEPGRQAALEARGIEIVRTEPAARGLDLAAVAHTLGERGVTGVLAEPGPRLAASLLEGGFVDRWTAFLAPDWVKNDDALRLPLAAAGLMLEEVEWEIVGRDAMVTGLVRRPV